MPRASSIQFPYIRSDHLPRVSAGPAVLLVADDPETGSAASLALRAAGYEVRAVRLGHRGIGDPRTGRGLVRDPVELVVLDASRRPSRAMSLLEALRAADGAIPAIVIASGDAETREEAARLGAEAVLDCPLDHARLRTAAEALVPVLREFDRDVETRGYSFH